MRLENFLSSRHLAFTRMPHQPAFTANRVAQVLHVPGKEVAKSVLLRTPHGYVLAVLPATHQVDLAKMKQNLDEEEVGLASEEEAEQIFCDCERGAMPPFGSIYDLPTVVDRSLAQDDQIVFEGECHEEAIRMSFTDFAAAELPRIGEFACPN